MPSDTEKQTTTETPETEESLQNQVPTSTAEEESSSEGPAFEEPDFAAITDFVESSVVEEEPPAAKVEDEQETPAEEEVETPPEETAKPEESESKETAKEEEETPPEKTEETPPEEVEVAAEETEQELEPIKLPTREELDGMYTEHREKMLPELEKVFTLSDEEAAALDEQPSKMLPKLAAQLQYDAMLSTYNAVMTALPSVIGTFTKANDLAAQASGQFMDAWPDLNNKKSEPAVKAAIQAYRSANPQATLEDTIKNAGVMAMINLGLDPTKKTEEKPVVEKKTTVPPAKPVAPTGASPEPPVKTEEAPNEFAALTDVFLQEMEG